MSAVLDSLPPIFRWLAEQENIAASDALAAALPDVEPGLAATVADTLMKRSDEEAPAGLIAQYHRLSPDVKRLCVERVDRWFQDLGRAIKHVDEGVRANAVAIITDAADPRLAYLLTIALRDPQPRVRAAAAAGLRAVCDRAVSERERFMAAAREANWCDAARTAELQAMCTEMLRSFSYIVPALEQAMDSFQHHLRTEVLEPVVWCFRHVQSRHASLHAVARARLDWAVCDVFSSSLAGRNAEFAWLALRYGELKSKIAGAIRTSRSPEFMTALIDRAWMTGDAEIRRGLHAVQKMAWLDGGADATFDRDGVDPDKLVRLVRASGISGDQQAHLFRSMVLGAVSPGAQRAGLWGLVAVETPLATQTLKTVAEWNDDALAPIATWELLRRCPQELHALLHRRRRGAGDAEAPVGLSFEAFWDTYDRLGDAQRTAAAKTLVGSPEDIANRLRRRIRLSPEDRRRAIGIVRTLGWEAEFGDEIAALARDADSAVRSAAVAALASLHTPAARRSTRDALEDPDDRVQANAIEALAPDQIVVQAPALNQKLHHRDNRVRANAVKRLLEVKAPDAARALIEMLDDANRAHRTSALWIVERLKLSTLYERIETMAAKDPDARIRTRARRLLQQIRSTVAVRDEQEVAP